MWQNPGMKQKTRSRKDEKAGKPILLTGKVFKLYFEMNLAVMDETALKAAEPFMVIVIADHLEQAIGKCKAHFPERTISSVFQDLGYDHRPSLDTVIV